MTDQEDRKRVDSMGKTYQLLSHCSSMKAFVHWTAVPIRHARYNDPA